ncbi:MAG: Ig-like domain-containing protein [Kofleriaceae bacterium]
MPEDPEPPSVSITSPAVATTYSTAQTVTFTATASDDDGIARVEFYEGATLLATEIYEPYNFVWQITSADNGSHSFTAKAFDELGNSTISSPRVLTVNIGGGGGGGGGTALQLYDNFNGSLYNLTSDGATSPNALWRTQFVSGGYAKTVQDPTNSSNAYLVTAPRLDTLRAVHVNSTQAWKGIHGKMRARLDAQLQPAQGWYTIWPLIAYVDVTTHYYFNLKTNGWELGKKDNDLDPALEHQWFIRTGTSPRAVIGQWATIEWWVVPDPATSNIRLRVDVDGVTVVDVLDNTKWERNGQSGIGASSFFFNADKKVALYAEASQVSWDDVYISPATSVP